MLGTRLVKLIERHSEEISQSLMNAVLASEHTTEYRKLPAEELRAAGNSLYAHLGDWLTNKSRRDVDEYFSLLGARRAAQKIPASQLTWALMMSKAQLWTFVDRESAADKVYELYVELEFLLLLDRFFDRAIHSALVGYEQSAHISKAA